MLGQGKRKTDIPAARSAALHLFLIAALLVPANARLFSVFAQSTEGLIISASFADKPVAPDEAIEFQLNRPLSKEEGTLAIVIGQADLTALFTLTGKIFRYDAKALPLPSGESPVVLYKVSTNNNWEEIARFKLRVGNGIGGQESGTRGEAEVQQETSSVDSSSPSSAPDAAQDAKPPQKKYGFEKLDFIPAITLSFNSQPAQSNFPSSSRPDRATFTDLNLQMSYKSDMERGIFGSQTQFDFVGSSFEQSALRFGQLGERAPQVDLSSYLMQFKLGKIRYQAGHFSFGASRHLMSSFSSRGLMITVPLTNRVEIALSAMNGTSIVGYSNFFGIDKSRHRLLGGTFGFEFFPKRPAALRAEVSLLDAWLQPVNSFSQGSVNDAERSRGLAFRVLASDPSQRLKIDAGFARSRFTSLQDPLVSQGLNLISFPSVARNARYLDASYDILKDVAVTKETKANLTFTFRHERVDPLYRSLGASAQADKVSNDYSLTGSIGEINAQFTHGRFNDNLRNIPSILKSLTRGSSFNVGLPLASLFGKSEQPSPFLPRLSYTMNRTGQFGAAIPIGGGFEIDLSSIPDQVGTNQAFNAEWQIQKWRLGYRLNHSFQNNRQTGREASDLAGLVNGFTVAVSLTSAIDLNFDLNAESATSIDTSTVDRVVRLAPTLNWRMSQRAAFASTLSITIAGDEAETKRNHNVEFDMQWSYQFGFERDRFRKLQGQFFIRYANRYALTRNNLFSLNDLQKVQIINLGLSFNIF